VRRATKTNNNAFLNTIKKVNCRRALNVTQENSGQRLITAA